MHFQWKIKLGWSFFQHTSNYGQDVYSHPSSISEVLVHLMLINFSYITTKLVKQDGMFFHNLHPSKKSFFLQENTPISHTSTTKVCYLKLILKLSMKDKFTSLQLVHKTDAKFYNKKFMKIQYPATNTSVLHAMNRI